VSGAAARSRGGRLWHEYVAVRDYVRAHTGTARQFADVKRFLAARFARDREAYPEAKSVQVEVILRPARADRG
jgi:GrpB-like predicted nucleotidyltransferase (UPF0157 family)